VTGLLYLKMVVATGVAIGVGIVVYDAIRWLLDIAWPP
jgi:hypothetical protein